MKRLRVSPGRLLDVMEYLVDDHVGIIREVEEWPGEAGDPAFFYFYAWACDTSAFCPQRNSREGGGVSADRLSAMAKATGEAVERYCSAIYDRKALPLAAFDSAPFPCVAPNEFALYRPEQYAEDSFPFVPFQESTPVRWTPAVELISGETCYVPASMVFVPYSYNKDCGELPIMWPISTGLACHMSFSEAAISAICEVIERDAFTITWQAKLAMPQIKLESLSDRNRNLVARFERIGSSITLLNLAMDHGVPTILAVLRGRKPEQPALVFAASAHPDPELAVRKSLEEVAHTRRQAQYLKATLAPPTCGPHYNNVVDQDSHLHLYSLHENARLADFIFMSSKRLDFGEIESLATGDPNRDLEVLTERVRSVSHRVLWADLTTPDVADLGLSVIRAIIPGFHPLVMKHRLRALGGRRLWEVPQKLGHRGINPASGDNPVPHPYP